MDIDPREMSSVDCPNEGHVWCAIIRCHAYLCMSIRWTIVGEIQHHTSQELKYSPVSSFSVPSSVDLHVGAGKSSIPQITRRLRLFAGTIERELSTRIQKLMEQVLLLKLQQKLLRNTYRRHIGLSHASAASNCSAKSPCTPSSAAKLRIAMRAWITYNHQPTLEGGIVEWNSQHPRIRNPA